MEALNKFNDEVDQRPQRSVSSDDLDHINTIASLLTSETQQAGWGDGLKVTDVPGVMSRVHLLEGRGVHARWHLFREASAASETNVHSHGSAFVSYSVAGQYRHKIWQAAEPRAEEQHYRFPRSSADGSLGAPDKQPGKLVVGTVHTHHPGLSYYIHEDAHHSVEAIQAPILTLWVKGAERKSHPASVLSFSEQPEEAGGAPAAEDRELHGKEKESVLKEIRALCAGARPPDPKEEFLVYLKHRSRWELRCLLCDKWVPQGCEAKHGSLANEASEYHKKALKNYFEPRDHWFLEHVLPRKARWARPLREDVRDGWTQLLWSSYEGKPQEVSKLLALGADPEQRPDARSFEGTYGKTPLFYSVDAARKDLENGVEVARLLLMAGADPNAQKRRPSMSAAAYARDAGLPELSRLFDEFCKSMPSQSGTPKASVETPIDPRGEGKDSPLDC